MTTISKKRKAISPLIATVLLIAFVITIAALIQNFNVGLVGSQLTSATDKSTTAINCAYGKIKIESASYNATASLLKLRVTNNNQNSRDSALTNITFSAIMNDGSSNVFATTCNCAGESLAPGETKFFSNGSVSGGCNITSLYVSSSCPNARDSIISSGIDFTGC
jgi:flagellin-like protein